MRVASVFEIVVVGCSAGGLSALRTLLRGLSAFSLPVVIVQHRSRDSDDTMTEVLRADTRVDVREANDKDPLGPGVVVVGPPDYHLLVDRGSVSLSVDDPVSYSRPSIDVLFESAAASYGPAAVGVLLTGANGDGTRGLGAIRAAGGFTIAQDPNDAESPTMPASAIAANVVDRVLPLGKIPSILLELAR